MKYIRFDQLIVKPPTREVEVFSCSPDPSVGDWSHSWDIVKAKRLMFDAAHLRDAARFSQLKRMDLTAATVAMIRRSKTEIDWEYVKSDAVDPREPLIMVSIDGRDWIIDGWHRVNRAIEMKWRCVPVFILTPEQDQDCRVCECCKEQPTVGG